MLKENMRRRRRHISSSKPNIFGSLPTYLSYLGFVNAAGESAGLSAIVQCDMEEQRSPNKAESRDHTAWEGKWSSSRETFVTDG